MLFLAELLIKDCHLIVLHNQFVRPTNYVLLDEMPFALENLCNDLENILQRICRNLEIVGEQFDAFLEVIDEFLVNCLDDGFHALIVGINNLEFKLETVIILVFEILVI